MSQLPANMPLAQASGNPANVGVGGAPLQGGALNFGSVPGMNDYAGAYQNALSLNQQNYANILSGYQQVQGQQQTAQQAIEGGYGNLYNTVMGGIQGIGASQEQAIKDTYAQQSGQSAQQLINSGLGNTTVQQSVQRGNLLDRMKAETGLANQMAQLQAGYQSNLGLAGLNYANQANMQNTALKGQQLNWMNSINSPYPNAAAYGQLALQQGYANQAQRMYGMAAGNRGLAGGIGGGGVNMASLGGGSKFMGLGNSAGGQLQTLPPGGGGGGGQAGKNAAGSYGGYDGYMTTSGGYISGQVMLDQLGQGNDERDAAALAAVAQNYQGSSGDFGAGGGSSGGVGAMGALSNIAAGAAQGGFVDMGQNDFNANSNQGGDWGGGGAYGGYAGGYSGGYSGGY